jgi:hypothetical protein
MLGMLEGAPADTQQATPITLRTIASNMKVRAPTGTTTSGIFTLSITGSEAVRIA